MGKKLSRKASIVPGGHTISVASILAYFSVVSRDRVIIMLTILVLNDLKVLSNDIQNSYLTTECLKKI